MQRILIHVELERQRGKGERDETSPVIGGFGGGARAIHSDVGDAVKSEMVKVVVRRRCYLGDNEAVGLLVTGSTAPSRSG